MYTVQYPDGREALFHDPTDIIGQLRHYLSRKVKPQWCSGDQGRQILPLYISGGIKSGKTFLMNIILPAVMVEMATFADTSALQINVSGVDREQGFNVLCKSLLELVLKQAARKNIRTQALSEASMDLPYASLIDIFMTMDIPLTIQMDEVQHLLSPRRPSGGVDKSVQRSVAQLLKTLWCYSSRHCQWTVTGSGMALFWVPPGLMPANGISPLTHRVSVHLPHEHSQEAKTQVLQHLLAADGKPSPQGTLPSGYELLRDYADNCAMLSFAYDDYDEVQPMHQHLDQLDRDKLAKESMAEWQDIVRFEFDMDKRRALASLYNTLDGCDLSLLKSPGLVQMLSTLTARVEGDPKRVYFISQFHRAGLALCVTLDGKVVDPFSGLEADRRLHLCDAFVQMALISNKAKKLVRDPAYNQDPVLCAEVLKEPAEALQLPGSEGPAEQWRTKKWFQAVLFAAENQGPHCKKAAVNEAEVRRNTKGTAAAYLREVDSYRRQGQVMPAERHLAWYLNMLRNAHGHAEDADTTLSPAQASAGAFTLLLDSPVVQPTMTIPKRFDAIRRRKLP